MQGVCVKNGVDLRGLQVGPESEAQVTGKDN